MSTIVNNKKEYTEAEINLNSAWNKGEDIIKSVIYQVYGMGAFRGYYGDEEINYVLDTGVKTTTYSWTALTDYTGNYNKEAATLPTISDNTQPLAGYIEGDIIKVGTASWGWTDVTVTKPEGVADSDIHTVASLPTKDIIENGWYYIEGTGYYQYVDKTVYTYDQYTVTRTYNDPSTIAIKLGSDADYKGELKPSDTIEVTITPSADLLAIYPENTVIVSIDGKEYTPGVLSNPITFYMNRDHRVSINWKTNEVVETFRIIARR